MSSMGAPETLSIITPSTAKWRASHETQTDVSSFVDVTSSRVHEAFFELHMTSRRGLELARDRDMTFLDSVYRWMLQKGQQYRSAMSVVVEEMNRGRAQLSQLEAEHMSWLINWECQERRIAQLNEERRFVVEATWALLDNREPSSSSS